jgi:hypothetical protein
VTACQFCVAVRCVLLPADHQVPLVRSHSHRGLPCGSDLAALHSIHCAVPRGRRGRDDFALCKCAACNHDLVVVDWADGCAGGHGFKLGSGGRAVDG